eukprot:TRINITY_DN92_c0_g1_i3.p1 TRINITY_DN92_c0_g1~~TRINITY_DN92_c0_g1_i3.p1  ORF type:complete len:555 (+),score=206.34 TRINITY_DN92_c0_g1_i3:111-1775(+)
MSLTRVLLAFFFVGVACAVYFDAGSSGIKVVLNSNDSPKGFNAKAQHKNKALAFYGQKTGVMYRGLAAVAMAYKVGCNPKNPSAKDGCQKIKYQYLIQGSRAPAPTTVTAAVMSPAAFVQEAVGFLATADVNTTNRIPILATAGMRPPEVPQDVFTSTNAEVGICIQNASPRTPKVWALPGPNGQKKYASDDSQCRVISGTEEALLEFVGQEGVTDQRGTATMGGASAQIAIPLVGTPQVTAWNGLIDSVKLAAAPNKHSTSPLWFPGSHPRPASTADEYKNYIDIRTSSQVAGWGAGAIATATTGANGVGLLSFLAIANRAANDAIGNRNVFGGSDAIEAILESKHFGADGGPGCKTFSACHAAVLKAFVRDPFLQHIVPVFRRHFSYVPVLLAGGMDIGRTVSATDAAAVTACTTPTGILSAAELEVCLRATYALLETRCGTANELRAINPDTGSSFCKTGLARFIITDALWGNNSTRIGRLGHGSAGFVAVPTVDIKFGTKTWAGGAQNGGADPAVGFSRIGTFTPMAGAFGIKKRNVNVNRRQQKNRRHH